MPSLDGHSLSREIDKLREDVYGELAKSREAFSELYQYILRIEKTLSEQNKKEPKKKGAKDAKGSKK
tara:strand:+ start:8152 stop:8352 length:201 start_codon:yes stop_codon:yes gene_type:complete